MTKFAPAVLTTACLALLGTALLRGFTPQQSVRADSTAERRGREDYVARGCAHCHGDQREGTDRAPELRTVRKRMKADAVEKQIREGGQGMPAFGNDLNPAELDDLVAYVRDKHEPTSSATKAP